MTFQKIKAKIKKNQILFKNKTKLRQKKSIKGEEVKFQQ